MVSNAPRQQDSADSFTTPWANLLQFQQDLLKLNLSAGAEFSRRALQVIETREIDTEATPTAPLQLMQFMQDCMKLSLSPVSMLTAGALKPFTGLLSGTTAEAPPRATEKA